MIKITIPGRPVPKKNSSVMVPGMHKIFPSKAFQKYQKYCIGTKRNPGVLMQWGNICFKTPVHVECKYWLPDYRWWPDLIGLLQGTSDLLEAAGIIENDRLIASYDGSKIVGLDRDNPRAEITISSMEGEKHGQNKK